MICDRCGEDFPESHIVVWENDYGDGQHCQKCYDWLSAYAEYQAELAEEERAEREGAEK